MAKPRQYSRMIASYEQTQESLAQLKMLDQSSKSIQDGRSKPVKKGLF